MPSYNVVIHATGITIPGKDGAADCVGFYRVQHVRAASAAAAQAAALAAIAAEWEAPGRASTNQGSLPTLVVESTTKVSWRHRFRHRNGGHAFYPADDEPAT